VGLNPKWLQDHNKKFFGCIVYHEDIARTVYMEEYEEGQKQWAEQWMSSQSSKSLQQQLVSKEKKVERAKCTLPLPSMIMNDIELR
jgi:predicted SprT family Zn-dependent metalloprotease